MRPAVHSLPRRSWPIDTRLVVCILLALAAAVFAYQAPSGGRVAVGWLGDRLFLLADPGAGTPDSPRFYADELTPGAPANRSRWTRRQAVLTFPALGRQALSVELAVQGWPEVPADAPVRQPDVVVLAGDEVLGRFTPDAVWRSYHFDVPPRTVDDLILRIETSHTFSDSLAPDGTLIVDPRPKGVRLAGVTLQTNEGGLTRLLVPSWLAVLRLTLAAALLYLALHGWLGRPNPAFVLTVLLVAGAALALALARLWVAALLPVLLPWMLVLVLLGYWRPLLGGCAALVRRYGRGSALGYGLLAAGLCWLTLTIVTWARSHTLFNPEAFWANFPDSLLYIIFLIALLLLVFVQGRNGLPRGLAWLQQRLLTGQLALVLLLALGGLWLGYQALLLRDLPAIGHADYADNGVVARNLLRGRGWVVDYVTQYYRLYNDGASVTRPQETWPLLQPLWILPFFRAFGPSDWAARLPNLVFNGLLLLLIYNIGASLWDRRVGLSAALITLTNVLFFNTAIYATSDLAFVVFATGALYCLYLAFVPADSLTGARSQEPGARSQEPGARRLSAYLLVVAAGLLSGLMLLQRPSSGVIAAGMGLWVLVVVFRKLRLGNSQPRQGQAAGYGAAQAPMPVTRPVSFVSRLLSFASALLPPLLWGGIALLLLTPYLARNQQVFGKLFYSTESHDAWVIEYSPDWDDIYNIYIETPPLGGPGVPDRSWILRWGFDTTLRKIERQWIYLRNLLLPAWQNGSFQLALKSEQDSITLLHTMGGWLVLAALPVALRRKPRLLGLLGLAFVPYLLFLIGYWHVEERYLPVLMPWLALLAMGLLWSAYDRLAALHEGRWSGLALAGVIAAIVAVVQPSWPAISAKIRDEPQLWAPDLEVYQWLRTQPPDTVVMTRGPWQLNFYAERPAIMIPNTADVDRLLYLASYYRARFLVVETIQNTGAAGQQALRQLTLDRAGGEECRPTPEGQQRPDRRLPIAYCSRFYDLEDGRRYQTVVYRFPDNYGGVASLGERP